MPAINRFDTDGILVSVQHIAPGMILCCCAAGIERDALVKALNYQQAGAFTYSLSNEAVQPQPCRDQSTRKHFVLKEEPA